MADLRVTDVDEWQELTSASFAPIRCTPTGPVFLGSIDTRPLDTRISMSRITSSSLLVGRTNEMVERFPSDDVLLTLQIASTSYVNQHDRRAALAPGSAAIFEARSAYVVDTSAADQEQILLRMPRAALDIGTTTISDVCARTIDGADPLMRVFMTTASAVFDQANDLDVGARRDVESLLIDLVRSTLLRSTATLVSVQKHSTTDRLVRYIEDNLGDSELDVPRIAAAHFVSTRSVYEAFAVSGETPARFIRMRRIELAEKLLSRGASVGEVSLACGFGTVDTLIRAFRRTHGTTPAAWTAMRRAAG